MQKYTFKNGHTTCFEHIKPLSTKTQSFTVVYTHGFCSDPMGRKPEEIKNWCIEHGMGYFRYELAGHGSDVARFEETTINTYKNQIFEVVNEIIDGDVLLVGSSLGGWLSLLACCQFPKKIIGMIGLAAAPDFLKTYVEAYFTEEHRQLLERDGKVYFPTNDFNYTITKQMIDSAAENLMLEKENIPYKGKVRLIQGMKDAALDWRVAPLIAKKLLSDDVQVYLLKEATHRLGNDENIEVLFRTLDEFLL